MLTITVESAEMFNEKTLEFIEPRRYTIQLEHSLISLSKWEAKWNKPFLSKENKTGEETLDYIKCMTVSQNIPEEAYMLLSSQNMKEIEDYIAAPMSGTKISKTEQSQSGKKQIITSEVIYGWMVALGIPFECQKWHLNRLLMLIQVCGIQNSPPKKMSKREIYKNNRSLNEARRAKANSRG